MCPTSSKGLDLLLGKPYLRSIKAIIDVDQGSIDMGDASRKEKRVKVQLAEVTPINPAVEPESAELGSESEDGESTSEEDATRGASEEDATSDEDAGGEDDGNEESDDDDEDFQDFQ